MDNLQRTERDDGLAQTVTEVLPQNLSIWHVVGGLALVGIAAVVIMNIPDIKRYIRISSM